MDSKKNKGNNLNNNQSLSAQNSDKSNNPIKISFDQLPDSEAKFDNLSLENTVSAFSDVTPPTFASAKIYTGGLQIRVLFDEPTSASLPLLPSTNAENFYIEVENKPLPVFSVTRDSANNKAFFINLSTPIIHDYSTGFGISNISLSYTEGNVRNSVPLYVTSFADENVDIVDTTFPVNFFDPLDWVLSGYLSTIPKGDLFERRVSSATGLVILDTAAPTGEIIINESPEKGGMQIHYFGCYATNDDTETPDDILTGSYLVQDIFENTVKVAADFGGVDSPNQTETIGDGLRHSVVNFLEKVSGSYPIVKSIEFGITSDTPKNYILEVKRTPTDTWHELLYMYASDQTLEYYRYVFTSNSLRLYAIRLRHRGDYYYQENSGHLTIAASDGYSGIKAIQASHYSDFRDADEFVDKFPAGADLGDNWVRFSEGTSGIGWSILNQTKFWENFAGTGVSGNKIIYFKNSLIVASDRVGSGTSAYLYSFNSSGIGRTVYSSASLINDFAIHENVLYVALEGGRIVKSDTGNTFSNAVVNLPPVRAIESYKSNLWIGTGTSNTSADGKIYFYSPTSNSNTYVRSFTEASVSTLAHSPKYLFLGLSGTNKGLIYYSDGATWTQAKDTGRDRVDSIEYNSITSEMWAGDSGGTIYSFAVTNNSVDNAARVYDQSVDRYYNFIDSPDSEFFWTISSNNTRGVIAYVNDLSAFKAVSQPAAGLIKDLTYWGTSVYGVTTLGTVLKLDTTIIGTNEHYAYVKLKDFAGNISTVAINDSIVYGTASIGASGSETLQPKGTIYQIRPPVSSGEPTYITSYTSPTPTSALFAPSRVTRQTGLYESEPFYSATLSRWDTIQTIASYAAGSSPGTGLETGVSVDLYIRAADTRSGVLAADWGEPFTYSTIGTSSASGVITNTYSLSSYSGKWLQWKSVLTTASLNTTPYLNYVALSYFASDATYFYTRLFDSASVKSGETYAEYRRGLLTFNGMANGGTIQFKYTTSTDDTGTFDMANYTDLTPNSVFELDQPSRYIRFAAQLISVGSDPAVVDEFAVQLDVGADDLYWMKPETLASINLSSVSVTGGAPGLTGLVSIVGPAPVDNVVITLTSDSVHAVVPASVTITSTNSQVSFNITTTSVAEITEAVITATSPTGSLSIILTINP
jgi:hypothetical protein